MSIVQPRLRGARVLDLYAGSGALGLEALSRGAAFADIVERHARTFRVLQENVAALGAEDSVRLHRADALTFASAAGHLEYGVAFADPPYDTGAAAALAEAWLAAPFAAVLGIEHTPRETLPGEPDSRRYGSSVVSFYYFPAR